MGRFTAERDGGPSVLGPLKWGPSGHSTHRVVHVACLQFKAGKGWDGGRAQVRCDRGPGERLPTGLGKDTRRRVLGSQLRLGHGGRGERENRVADWAGEPLKKQFTG